MRLESSSHLHGELVAEHRYASEHQSLLRALSSLPLLLRNDIEFSEAAPRTPKRHRKSIAGRAAFHLLPVSQSKLNKSIESALVADGWERQPRVTGNLSTDEGKLNLKGDFAKNGVFVEVEFGNTASLFRDIFKFQVANRSGAGQVAVAICAMDRFARFFDSGVTTFEAATRLLPYLAIGIQMPIWFLGIEPDDYSPVKKRYREMQLLCEKHKLACHEFDVVFSRAPSRADV